MTHLDLLDEVLLERGKDDLSLTGLETICHGGNGTDVVGHREQDQFLVDKVLDRDLVDVVVQVGTGLMIPSSSFSKARRERVI